MEYVLRYVICGFEISCTTCKHFFLFIFSKLAHIREKVLDLPRIFEPLPPVWSSPTIFFWCAPFPSILKNIKLLNAFPGG